ncbi:hypothetical protein HOP50_04g27920 [Chloropicon primus]|uniref:DUF2834 domain-containing protein n=1 Tax=Chloropicon primus TaxID=1764295 RepID=A0A5B8MKP7_9CHLO|nr:hypothetical protein A3770_04p27930 [Chloropicon primus]UPQ99484.1 hypothetical protein HOP50_04g27920 [Chloropicon primus]|eukprot:QDZ20275.1 hypothetical protein A3770_04p27930 [Chloropicon primus]
MSRWSKGRGAWISVSAEGRDGEGRGGVESLVSSLANAVSSKSINVGFLALWLGFGVYAFKFAPNLATVTDRTLIQASLNMGIDEDGVVINRVFFALFNVLGLWPVIYASLLLPTGVSGNKVPAWPFVSLSMFLGAFGLLPYFALWEPSRMDKVYRSRSRITNFFESKANALLVLAALGYLSTLVLSATGSDWAGYFQLFDKSRFTHVSTLDFCVLTLLAPFWVLNDAERRNWDKGDTLLTALSLVPLYGPALYLLLRPKLPNAPEEAKPDE